MRERLMAATRENQGRNDHDCASYVAYAHLVKLPVKSAALAVAQDDSALPSRI